MPPKKPKAKKRSLSNSNSCLWIAVITALLLTFLFSRDKDELSKISDAIREGEKRTSHLIHLLNRKPNSAGEDEQPADQTESSENTKKDDDGKIDDAIGGAGVTSQTANNPTAQASSPKDRPDSIESKTPNFLSLDKISPLRKQKHAGSISTSSRRSGVDETEMLTKPMSWNEFINLPTVDPSVDDKFALPDKDSIKICGPDVTNALTEPQLSKEKFEWCQWALSPSGGKVQVGKSYGTLNAKQRDDYEQYNCNSVQKGKNPSCDDVWGDGYLYSWRNNPAGNVCGKPPSEPGTKISCFDSSSQARFCKFDNVMFDFSKMHNTNRGKKSRSWDNGFLATDCSKSNKDIGLYSFYKPMDDPSTATCDYVITTPVLAYSHDDINNIGHTLSDLMNVWAMLWLSSEAPMAKDMHFLNIDAIRMGHNFDDQPSQFFRHYELTFKDILKAIDFGPTAKVCFKHLIMQPKPLILFTWDGWWQDMKCSFVGPSSLFQRWNLQVRQKYDLLRREAMPTNEKLQILLIIRKSKSNIPMYTSRVFANEGEIVSALKTIQGAELVVQDLAALSFTQQVQLISSSSLIIGVHGAGIANTMHMPIGTKYCCGVIEIFPDGEFKTIRGYGNMARRMGHHYERLMLGGGNSGAGGSRVPTDQLLELVNKVKDRMIAKSTCVLPAVVEDPYFLKGVKV